MTHLKTHVKYNVLAMTNLKTHVNYNVSAMTNSKTHVNSNKKQARAFNKKQKPLKTNEITAKIEKNQSEYSFVLLCARVLKVFEMTNLKTHANNNKNGARPFDVRHFRCPEHGF